jgi:RNA polymerase sigma-70 factor (sigma-E family)
VTNAPELAPSDPGPAAGFEAFYGHRYRDAVRLAYVITGDPGTAEDIAQEALLRVRPRFERLREPWPYTRAAIVNVARSHARRGRREQARLELVATSSPAVSTSDPTELLDAIDALPFRQKAVIVLRYYEDLSEREIASVLRCRPGTVKSLASRALSRLAQEIQR